MTPRRGRSTMRSAMTAVREGRRTLRRKRKNPLVLRAEAAGRPLSASGRSVNHSDRHGVIRGIQRGTAARNASYSLPNVISSLGSSYATTWMWKASHNSAP